MGNHAEGVYIINAKEDTASAKKKGIGRLSLRSKRFRLAAASQVGVALRRTTEPRGIRRRGSDPLFPSHTNEKSHPFGWLIRVAGE